MNVGLLLTVIKTNSILRPAINPRLWTALLLQVDNPFLPFYAVRALQRHKWDVAIPLPAEEPPFYI